MVPAEFASQLLLSSKAKKQAMFFLVVSFLGSTLIFQLLSSCWFSQTNSFIILISVISWLVSLLLLISKMRRKAVFLVAFSFLCRVLVFCCLLVFSFFVAYCLFLISNVFLHALGNSNIQSRKHSLTDL